MLSHIYEISLMHLLSSPLPFPDHPLQHVVANTGIGCGTFGLASQQILPGPKTIIIHHQLQRIVSFTNHPNQIQTPRTISSRMIRNTQLVFIPSPWTGHLVPTIRFAKLLLDRDSRFSAATFLVMTPPFAPDIDIYAKSLAAEDSRIRIITLPQVIPPSSVDLLKSPENYISVFIEGHKPHVKNSIVNQVMADDVAPLAGLVIDMFCTSMIDVANELGLPSYLFFTCNAAFLGLMLYLPAWYDIAGTEFKETDPDSIIPTYVHPVPSKVMPLALFNEHGGFLSMQNHGRRFKETQGIIVNSFAELEAHSVNYFLNGAEDIPPVYTVGPLIDLQGLARLGSNKTQRDEIMKWLDDQPDQSVVLLCFGSMGSFSEAQLHEIALGLERSGHRFLWSIRKPPPKDQFAAPSDYEIACYEAILPDGFMERTSDTGLVCGWVPQVEILGHKAIGGFLSHCGWNSILESLWHGVPVATWPMYADQQINAFEMVKDLGLVVEMRLDYRERNDVSYNELVMADEIEKAVRSVMEKDSGVRKRVEEVSEMSRKAVVEGGSSFIALGRLIDKFISGIDC